MCNKAAIFVQYNNRKCNLQSMNSLHGHIVNANDFICATFMHINFPYMLLKYMAHMQFGRHVSLLHMSYWLFELN